MANEVAWVSAFVGPGLAFLSSVVYDDIKTRRRSRADASAKAEGEGLRNDGVRAEQQTRDSEAALRTLQGVLDGVRADRENDRKFFLDESARQRALTEERIGWFKESLAMKDQRAVELERALRETSVRLAALEATLAQGGSAAEWGAGTGGGGAGHGHTDGAGGAGG